MHLRTLFTAKLAALVLLGLAFACNKPEENDIAVTGVSLSAQTLTLEEGESQTLTATVKPDNAANKAVDWKSSATAVATVDNNGKVTAVKAGSADITVTTKDGGKTATCKVTVNAKVIAVTGVTISPETLTLEEGAIQSLTATVTPENATDKAVEWKSSAADIATVDSNGKVTAVKAGSADITVTTKDGGKTATCAVTVNAKAIAVTGITVSPSSLTLEEGKSETLTAIIAPENATNKEVEWTSSETSVATVDGSGKVTAIKTGQTLIKAKTKDGGKVSYCAVTVTAKTIAVTGVTVSPTTLSLEEGASQTLTATVKPDNATNKAVEWKSSATGVATVDANGKVTAVKAGTADITATTKDGGKTATCKVTVTAKVIPVTGISWVQKQDVMVIGETITFKVAVTPSNATNPAVTWNVINKSVAVIEYSAGVFANIKAVGVGTSMISATAGGKSVDLLLTVKPSVYGVSITTKDKTDEYYISNRNILLTVDETYTLETQVSSQTSNADKSLKWQSEYPSNVSVTSLGNGKAVVKALSPRISGSTVLPVKIYAISNENPDAKDYIEVYAYSKPTSITCPSLSDPDMQYIKPGGYYKRLSFTVQPATARQGIIARTIPSTYGTWRCTISGMQADVISPNVPSNNASEFYNSAHSFLFSPIGARNATTPTVQVNMYPCDLYASDVKPMDYLYYNSSTGKFRSSDGGLRSYRHGQTVKLAVSPSKQSNETLVAIITYVGSVNDNLASGNGILSGLSNSSGTHGFAISLGYASTSTKWSDDKDDVDASSNWPSAAGSLFVSGDLFYDTWQNGWSLTQGAVIYNSKVGNSHKIKPVTLVVNYENSFPTSKITAATHWFVPTFSMGRIGMSNDDKSLVYHLSGSDNNRLQFLNQNITAAGGTPYNAKCWSINIRTKNFAYLVHGFNGMANSLLYPEKTETYAVRPWMVF